MKPLNKIVVILLNILFCTVFLWFFTRNAFLRPFSGSFLKEAISGLVLLGSLYINYFLLHPKIYQKHPYAYWIALVLIAITTGFVDFGLAKKGILFCAAGTIQIVGTFNFFLKIYFLIIFRNLAFNFFPFLFRERQHLQKSLEKEVRVVYQTVRMLDVTDKKSNILLVKIKDILYCRQQRNFTEVFVVQHKKYTRLGSMKHLEQLLGDDFIRISATELVSFRHIESCNEDTLIMKKMPWEEAPTTFKLEPNNWKEIAERVEEGITRYVTLPGGKQPHKKTARPKNRRKPITPSDDKIKAVLSCIEKNPNCNSVDIIAKTEFSLSTVGRCLYQLKQQGLIEHTGSKKTGGYKAVNNPPEEKEKEAERGEE